jgi:hypothetical protein
MLMKMWKKKAVIHFWWECKLLQSLQKSIWRFLKKLKIEIPYDLAIPLLGMYLKESKSAYSKDSFHTHNYHSTIQNSQVMESV